LGSRAGTALGIVTYHRVAPRVPGLPAPLHNVAPRRFREQLTTLLRHGYEFLPLTDVLKMRALGESPDPQTAVVTFDDGFESVYHYAWPTLRELGIPATIFVSTAYLDQNAAFPFDSWGIAYQGTAPPESYRPLTTEQCCEMLDGGLIDFGAHTHTHADFRGRPEEFRLDLQQSVDIVRERFDRETVTFAFPFGNRRLGFASEELVAAAKKTGVACGLTTESVLVDTRTDPFTWGRFNAFAWDSGATLSAKLGGWYDWAPKLYRRMLGKSRAGSGESPAVDREQLLQRAEP
jgi:peptidoglycan/xylan/chitin deacetylase (PgdA/CDA1 family)